MSRFSGRRGRRYQAPQEIKAASAAVSDAAVESLVKRTVSASAVQGLPENSRLRIKRGLEKLKAQAVPKPGATPSPGARGKGLLLALLLGAIGVMIVPLWAFLTLCGFAVIGVILFVALVGTERISVWVVARYMRLQQEDPEKAERLRDKAARASAMLTRFAERLPEKWVRGLYLPDFEPVADLPDKMRTDPFERLSV